MRILLIVLGISLISGSAFAGKNRNGAGNKDGFMPYCTDKQINTQPKEFCQCALDAGFDKAQKLLLNAEEQKIQSRRDQAVYSQEYSMRIDTAMNVERLDELCDVSDGFYVAKENFYLKITGKKKPLHTDYKQRERVLEIQKGYDVKAKTLHKQYGSNETTISHYGALGGGYCVQREYLVKEEKFFQEYLEKYNAGDVAVSYRDIIHNAVRHECRSLYKPK